MKQKIKSINPFKTSLSLALVAFALSFPAIGVMSIFSQFASRLNPTPFPWIILVTIPIGIAVFFFIFVWLGVIIYNSLARLGLCITLHMEP